MKRDDIMRMAREAGLDRKPADHNCRVDYFDVVTDYELERFAALVAAEEREARQAAQHQVAELQERLNRADAERCSAVLAAHSNAQQAEAQEPCGHFMLVGGKWVQCKAAASYTEPLFTRPQPAQLQPLTIRECAEETGRFAHVRSDDMLGIAEAIQSALASKNGAELK